MFVCICNPTTDKEIIECCSDGCSLEELKDKLQICQDCKSCSEEIKDIHKNNIILLNLK